MVPSPYTLIHRRDIMKLVTCWSTLFALANAVGMARMSGDADALKRAEEELKAYEDLVKQSDHTILCRRGLLDGN
jgi:hypothetical protein